MNKTVQDMKIEIESLKKTQTEVKLETKVQDVRTKSLRSKSHEQNTRRHSKKDS